MAATGAEAPTQAAENGVYAVSRGKAWFILVVCSLLYVVNYMDRQVFAVAMESIKLELALTDSQMGLIQTMFLLGMSLFAFPAAYMVDRWSRRKAIGVMAVAWSACTFLTGLGRDLWSVLIPRVLVGMGEAGFTSGGTPLIGAAFSAKARGRAMGVFNLAVPLGSALGMILGGAIAKTYGWRTPFFAFAVPGLLLGGLALFMKDYKTVSHRDETGRKLGFFRAAASLFAIPTLKWLYLGNAMQNFMVFSFLSWAPAYVMRAHGLDAEQAGMKIGLIGLMSIVGALLGGFIADAWQRRDDRGRMLTASCGMLGAAVLTALAVYYQISGPGFVAGMACGVFMVLGLPALSAVSQDVAPPSLKGISWGMNVFCQYLLGGAWGPVLVGEISDAMGGGAAGLEVGLLVSTLGGLAGALFYWISSRRYPADAKKVAGMTLQAE